QELESKKERSIDRKRQSRMARSIPGNVFSAMKLPVSRRDPSTSLGMTERPRPDPSNSPHSARGNEKEQRALEILKKIRGLEIKTRALVELPSPAITTAFSRVAG